MFINRQDAGQRLASLLRGYQDVHPLVLGLPRGGVPVAIEVAKALEAPVDVLVVRKLGTPGQPELGVGAIGEGGVQVLNRRLIDAEGLDADTLGAIITRERSELNRRVALYRGGRAPISPRGRTVLLVDDGLATGFTARAAIDVLRRAGAHAVILAIPVAPRSSVQQMKAVADAVACVETPPEFAAIGQWYRDFHQLSDAEVGELLQRGRAIAAARN